MYNVNIIIQREEFITPIPDYIIPLDCCKNNNNVIKLLLMTWYSNLKCVHITNCINYIEQKAWEHNGFKCYMGNDMKYIHPNQVRFIPPLYS